jgi:hypothetical protein
MAMQQWERRLNIITVMAVIAFSTLLAILIAVRFGR